MSYQLYRNTTLGHTLQESLDEFILCGQISNQIALKVLLQFDKCINVGLANRVKTRLSFKVRINLDFFGLTKFNWFFAACFEFRLATWKHIVFATMFGHLYWKMLNFEKCKIWFGLTKSRLWRVTANHLTIATTTNFFALFYSLIILFH